MQEATGPRVAVSPCTINPLSLLAMDFQIICDPPAEHSELCLSFSMCDTPTPFETTPRLCSAYQQRDSFRDTACVSARHIFDLFGFKCIPSFQHCCVSSSKFISILFSCQAVAALKVRRVITNLFGVNRFGVHCQRNVTGKFLGISS